MTAMLWYGFDSCYQFHESHKLCCTSVLIQPLDVLRQTQINIEGTKKAPSSIARSIRTFHYRNKVEGLKPVANCVFESTNAFVGNLLFHSISLEERVRIPVNADGFYKFGFYMNL